MKTNTAITFLILILSLNEIDAQSNSLTGSPYSLFGIGVESNSNTGRNSGMGQLGIALDSDNRINLYNPASFAAIEKERFVFDFGMFTEIQSVSNDDRNERRFASNFSGVEIDPVILW